MEPGRLQNRRVTGKGDEELASWGWTWLCWSVKHRKAEVHTHQLMFLWWGYSTAGGPRRCKLAGSWTEEEVPIGNDWRDTESYGGFLSLNMTGFHDHRIVSWTDIKDMQVMTTLEVMGYKSKSFSWVSDTPLKSFQLGRPQRPLIIQAMKLPLVTNENWMIRP